MNNLNLSIYGSSSEFVREYYQIANSRQPGYIVVLKDGKDNDILFNTEELSLPKERGLFPTFWDIRPIPLGTLINHAHIKDDLICAKLNIDNYIPWLLSMGVSISESSLSDTSVEYETINVGSITEGDLVLLDRKYVDNEVPAIYYLLATYYLGECTECIKVELKDNKHGIHLATFYICLNSQEAFIPSILITNNKRMRGKHNVYQLVHYHALSIINSRKIPLTNFMAYYSFKRQLNPPLLMKSPRIWIS